LVRGLVVVVGVEPSRQKKDQEIPAKKDASSPKRSSSRQKCVQTDGSLTATHHFPPPATTATYHAANIMTADTDTDIGQWR